MDEIDRVFSHAVALAQCRRFLAEHPRMKAVAFYDTAGSVKQLVGLRDRHAAAIASEAAAAYYGAEILARGIEDDAENYTRFFLVRRSGEAETDPAANKMSVAFTLEHEPGSLVAALSALSAMGTNLTKIESRPVQGKPWEYIFYVDCQIGSSEEGTRALEALACALRHGEGTGPLPRGAAWRRNPDGCQSWIAWTEGDRLRLVHCFLMLREPSSKGRAARVVPKFLANFKHPQSRSSTQIGGKTRQTSLGSLAFLMRLWDPTLEVVGHADGGTEMLYQRLVVKL